MTNLIRTYSELISLPTFEERFRYLKLNGSVGDVTFGGERCLNQSFYRSEEWKSLRDYVIVRDCGCDLAVEGYDIIGRTIFIHHMNPITSSDILKHSDYLIDPEYLITTTFKTHNAIHYGDESFLQTPVISRYKNDTCPWKR